MKDERSRVDADATQLNASRHRGAAYTPGHTAAIRDFMARRTLESHGSFFIPYLAPGVSVLDCGCGPGSMTLGIAARVTPGKVVGIDIDQSEIEAAIAKASHEGLQNVSFQTASCYALPVEDASFDRAFSNALMEHLAEPVLAMRELNRILKPGGIVGISGPDWSGFLLSPPSPALSRAVTAYTSLQAKNGGDVTVGRKLGLHLSAAGFVCVRMSARYECYASLGLIGEYLASQLEREGDQASADVFRTWAQHEGGMFAQAWVSAIATRP